MGSALGSPSAFHFKLESSNWKRVPSPAARGCGLKTMNVLVNRMVDQGLIDESVARGISGLLAEGEPPSRAFATCGVGDDALLQFLARELGLTFVDIEKQEFPKEFLAQFPARILLDKHILPVQGEDGELLAVTSNPFDTSAHRRAAAGHRPGFSGRSGPAGGDRPLHQAASGRRGRHGPIDDLRGQRKRLQGYRHGRG